MSLKSSIFAAWTHSTEEEREMYEYVCKSVAVYIILQRDQAHSSNIHVLQLLLVVTSTSTTSQSLGFIMHISKALTTHILSLESQRFSLSTFSFT